ncbi:FG-GAP repeat-containing protein [Singulisphaera sp. GP187]|uniref:S8 family serine peptidase n=1 Tax=Singulisphaera sp. GP187 TaxID=1882752 RepID=UPI0009277235|nr:S8 family serine peptidase [Singulisphaera sp. GP187]SIO26764.1 FG-GAP repeat-containing protein [Singulisphaera sp. GP187]
MHASAPPVRSRFRQRRTAHSQRALLTRLESLEERTLLSVAEIGPVGLLSANNPGLGAGDGIPADPATILWQGEQRPVVPGRWIVAMDSLRGTAATQLATGDRLLKQRSFGPAMTAVRGLGGRGSMLAETAPGVTYDAVKASLAGLPGFRYVEPDFIVSVNSTTPNDPNFSTLYGLDNTAQAGGVQDADIDAPEAWDLTTGSSRVVVGVIDSGVDYNHPDLAANMWRNPGEIPGDGIDNDGNGYKDDVYGYDFINGDGDPMDDYGHGTHVAGTLGAVGNNGVGVTGVNWQSRIMALKFLGADGTGPISAAISALNYATMMRNSYGVNIRLTNNSWGGGAFSQAMSDAIAASGNAGMLFVVAAGNNSANSDYSTTYPASYNLPNIIVVAATDQSDALASFSNYGATTVDLAAPGVGILSTTPNNTYSVLSGTSMAAPLVSGVAALAWSLDTNATYQKVRDALFAGVDPVPGLHGVTATGGRLNAWNTLNVILGDVGDTLSAARGTKIVAPGDRFAIPTSTIGDGPFASLDVDLYQLNASAGSTLTAVTSLPTGGVAMDTVLRLFDASGTPLAMNDDFAGYYSRLDYTFTAAGTYYVGVSAFGNANYLPTSGSFATPASSGTYGLDLSLDIGDTRQTAMTTGLGTGGHYVQPNGAIGDGPFGAADVDVYQFTAAAGTTFTAVSSQPSGGAAMDIVLRLFDGAGNPLALSDSPSTWNSRLSYRFSTAATYYLGVSGAGNTAYNANSAGGGTPGSRGDYRVEMTLDANSPAEFELSGLLANNAAGADGFVVTGTGDDSELRGPSLYRPLGDINGDGYDDMLLGAPGDTGPTSMTAGAVFLIFGRPGGYPAELSLEALDGRSGYRINGIALGDRTGISGGGAGDINHDGIPDLVIGASGASPSSDRTNAGQSYVLFGGLANLDALDRADGIQDGQIQLAKLDGTHGFAINGIAAYHQAGSVTGAGDLNHDGFDDLVIGALGVGSSGAAYVVFGRNTPLGASFPATLELATLNGSNGFTIAASGTSDTLGIALSGAGDVNGDGIADLILGGSTADPAGRTDAGQAYVLFGRSSFPAIVNLATLNGGNGFTINGNAAADNLGISVAGVGDVNGDGVDDVLIGAHGVDAPGKPNAGAAYLLFGKRTATAGGFPAIIEVTTFNGSTGVLFQGAAANDYGGYSVSGAGDVNGDGYKDILIGAIYADPHNIKSAGQASLVYGGRGFGARFELAGLLAASGGDGSNGFALNGFAVGGQAYAASGIGDLNHDGFADLRVSSPYVDANGLIAPGQVYVVFGKPTAPGIRVLPPSGLVTTEAGGTARFSLVLTTKPTANVTIAVSTSDASEGVVSVSSLTFTPTNWNQPQSVTVTGVNDTFSDGDLAYLILLGAGSSQDAAYNGLAPVNVSVINLDNDLVTTTFTKVENQNIPDQGTLTSSLNVAATGRILDLDVRVNINHSWDEDLDVTLIAPDGTRVELFTDVGLDGSNFTNTVLDDESATPITSGIAPFTGTYRPEGNLTALEGKNLAGTWKLEVNDDEYFFTGELLDWSITARSTSAALRPQAVVTPTSGLVTTEAGGKASFTVRLDNAPRSNVTIPVATSDATEGRTSTSVLTFTPANWNVAQTVTVTGVDDAIADGNVGYTIVLGPAVSADPDFDGINPADVTVTNTDNDFVTATFTKTANLAIPNLAKRTSVLTVSAAGTILDLDVKVNFSHTNDTDLDVFLIAPDNTRVELFTDVGGSGDHFTNTILSDEATTSITAGSAPFTGTFRPEGNLTLLEGKSLAGTWTLEVTDDAGGSAGTLLNWSLIVRYAAAAQSATVAATHEPAPTVAGAAAGQVITADATRRGTKAEGRTDLLSVALQELNHWLGRDLETTDLVASPLQPGTEARSESPAGTAYASYLVDGDALSELAGSLLASRRGRQRTRPAQLSLSRWSRFSSIF